MLESNPALSLDALKAGDAHAFASFVDLTSAQVYRTARRFLNDELDAEDVLQETYLKAFRSLPEFEGRSSLQTWLHRIAVNEALMLLRKRKPQFFSKNGGSDSPEEDTPEEMEIVDWCCLPERELLSSESQHFLDQAVRNLPDPLRLVFILRELEGLSVQETAAALNISENNVKVRLLRARLRLRQVLSAYFGEKMPKEAHQ